MPWLVGIGVMAGLASGVLGIGGGFLLVPLLSMWVGLDPRRISGTSLAAVLPIAMVGAAVYYFFRAAHQIDVPVAVCLVLGSSVGAYVGARAIRLVSRRSLLQGTAVLLLVVGLTEVWAGVSPSVLVNAQPAGGPELSALEYALVAVSGFLIGVLSGLTGLGGGVFLVPTMVIGFGLGHHLAQGTSLVAILPTAAVGAATHLRGGNVDLRAAGWIGVAGAPAAVVGAAVALALPQRLLALAFGMLLLFAAYRLWPRQGKRGGF